MYYMNSNFNNFIIIILQIFLIIPKFKNIIIYYNSFVYLFIGRQNNVLKIFIYILSRQYNI